MVAPVVSRLEVTDVSKTFGSVRVLNSVSMSVQPGHLHAVVGQNGSGKSTLVKVLTGYYTPDHGGAVRVDGNELHLPVSWRDAHSAGISVVHQDFGLLDHRSVAENIGVGGFARSRLMGRIDWRAQRQRAKSLLDGLHLDIDPRAPVGTLTTHQRAGVAIARAMRDLVPGAGLVILDESTRALGRDDLDEFHRMLRRVLDAGTSVLAISHNLDEVMTYADRVTVLRDGVVAATDLVTATTNEREIARLMLGKDVDAVAAAPSRRTAGPGIRVRGLVGDGAEGLDLEIGGGEVVGVTGMPGSGFEHLPYLIGGTRPVRQGVLEVGETTLDLTRGTVTKVIRAGVALVPERRDRDGLALSLSIQDNINLPTLRTNSRWHWIGSAWRKQQVSEATASLGIRPNAPMRLVSELSGGNQQKVLLAKWLTTQPRLLILHEPTQAVDVGARADILNTVRRVADGGLSVLLVSSEAADLIAVCDRVLVYAGPTRLSEIRPTDADGVIDAVYATAPSAS